MENKNENLQLSNEQLVLKVKFRSKKYKADSGWTIAMYEEVSDDGMIFKAVGIDLPIMHNVTINLYGRWRTFRGENNFTVQGWTVEPPTGMEEYKDFITSLKCGIGPKIFQTLWTRFGQSVLDMIENDPIKIKKFAPNFNAEIAAERSKKTRGISALMNKLGPGNPLEFQQIRKIIEKLGDQAIPKIESNPYSVAFVKGVGFQRSDELAKFLGDKPTRPARVIAAILYTLQTLAGKNGDTYLTSNQLDEMVKNLCRNSANGNVPTPDQIGLCRDFLVERKYIVQDGDGFYAKRISIEEHRLANNIIRLAFDAKEKPIPISTIGKFIAEYELSERIKLADSQKEAVANAIRRPFSVITGGAGTGKTTVVKCILWCLTKKLKESDTKIKLMAPTGRAARRMSEVTYMPAQTIHRAAGISVEGAVRVQRVSNDGKPELYLDAETIIVDEASMMDQHVAAELLEQVETGTRVIFIGDPGQLPSVGAGNVLHEMINSRCVPVTKLGQVFRQSESSPIVYNSQMIQKGSCDFRWEKAFQMHDVRAPEENLAQATLEAAVNFYLRCVKQFGIDDVILLNPFRKGKLTVDMFNNAIQSVVNPPKEKELSLSMNGTTFRKGDRVMQTKNQNSGIANGDTGVITRVYRARSEQTGERDTLFFDIDFDGQIETYDRAAMESVRLAYCTTVHKSQGGEWKIAIIIASPLHQRLMQRNLLYTAVTRGKEGVAIFGDIRSVRYAVGNDVVPERNTNLGQYIQAQYRQRNQRTGKTRLLAAEN